MASCSIKEQLSEPNRTWPTLVVNADQHAKETIKIQKDACGVEPHNEGRNISAVIWSLYVVAFFCVFARLFARYSNLDRYAWDDWTALACLVSPGLRYLCPLDRYSHR